MRFTTKAITIIVALALLAFGAVGSARADETSATGDAGDSVKVVDAGNETTGNETTGASSGVTSSTDAVSKVSTEQMRVAREAVAERLGVSINNNQLRTLLQILAIFMIVLCLSSGSMPQLCDIFKPPFGNARLP